jgi:hypothetical protein
MVPNGQYSDIISYDYAARHLATHYELNFGPASDYFRAWFLPGWPLFLSFFYKILGPATDVFKGVNVALSLLMVFLTVQIGAQVFDWRTGLLGGLLVAILPGWMVYVSLAQYEIFLCVLVMLILHVLLRVDWARVGWRSPALYILSLLMVWATFTRPPLALFPAIIIWFTVRAGAGRRGWAWGAVLWAFLAVVTAGWAARNRAVLGEPVLFSTNAGYNLWHGNNPSATGGATSYPKTNDPRINPDLIRGELNLNRLCARYAVEYIRDNPGRFVVMIPRRLFYLFNTDTTGIYQTLLHAPMNGPTILEPWRAGPWPERICFRSYLLLMMAALVGLALAPWRRLEVQLLGATIVYWLLPVVVSFAQDRYREPLMPIFCLFAAYAVQRVAARVKSTGLFARSATTTMGLAP